MGKDTINLLKSVETNHMMKDFKMYNWFLNKEVSDIKCDFLLIDFQKNNDGEIDYQFGRAHDIDNQLILKKENINTDNLSKDDYSINVRYFGKFEFTNMDEDKEVNSNLFIVKNDYNPYFGIGHTDERTISIDKQNDIISFSCRKPGYIDDGYHYSPTELELSINYFYDDNYKDDNNYSSKYFSLERLFKLSEEEIDPKYINVIAVVYTDISTAPPVAILFNIKVDNIEENANPKVLKDVLNDYLIGSFYDEDTNSSIPSYRVLLDTRNETFTTKKIEVSSEKVLFKGESEMVTENIEKYYKNSSLKVVGDTYIYSNHATGINAVYKKDFPTNAVITNDNFPYITDLKLIAEDENPINEFEYYTVELSDDSHVLSSKNISKMLTTFFDNYIPLDRQYKETIYASLSEENIKKNKSYIGKLSDNYDEIDFAVAAQVRFGITFNESTPPRLFMDIFITNNEDRYDVLLYVYDTACKQPSYYFARMHKSMIFTPSEDLKPVLYTGYDAFTEDDKLSLKNLYTCTTNIGLFDYSRGPVKNIAPFNGINATLNLITSIDDGDDLDTRKILEFTKDHCSIIKNEFGDILLAYEFGVLYPFNEDFFEFPVETEPPFEAIDPFKE